MEMKLIYQHQLSYHLEINFQARKVIGKQPPLLHVLLKQGKTWFTLENENVD